jgi:hypothetical protein
MISRIDRESGELVLLRELEQALDEYLHASTAQREQKKAVYLQGLREFSSRVLQESTVLIG